MSAKCQEIESDKITTQVANFIQRIVRCMHESHYLTEVDSDKLKTLIDTHNDIKRKS